MNNRLDDFRVVRFWLGLNRLAQLVLATALVLGLLYLASQPAFYFRRDISAAHAHSLSPETLAQLRSLSDKAKDRKGAASAIEVFLTLPDNVEGEGEEAEKMRQLSAMLKARVASLVETFSYELSREGRFSVSVEKLDPKLHLKTLNELRASLSEQGGAMTRLTTIVVRCGDKVRAIEAKDILAVSRQGLADPDRFRGEAAFLSALLDVTDVRRTVVYYTVNHGELQPNAKSPAYSDALLLADLRSRRFEVKPLNLEMEKEDVPKDADLILVAGPRLAFQPREVEMLRRYLRTRNGRMLALITPLVNNGLYDLLHEWGVRTPGALVVETDPNWLTQDRDIIVGNLIRPNQNHAAIRSFVEMGAPLVVGQLAPIQTDVDGAKDDATLDVRGLLSTSESASWGEWDVGVKPVYEPEKGDIPPPVGVCMVAERAVRVNGESRIPGGRLMVLGSPDPAADARYEKNGNRQFLLGAANWLTDREYLVNVPARPLGAFRVNATLDDLAGVGKRYALVPVAFALLGLLVGWWRRRV